jgi:hypothetical protein
VKVLQVGKLTVRCQDEKENEVAEYGQCLALFSEVVFEW